MREIMKRFPNSVARVKIDNHASHRVCQAAGQVAAYVIYKNPDTARLGGPEPQRHKFDELKAIEG
jgi:hypothetical protein